MLTINLLQTTVISSTVSFVSGAMTELARHIQACITQPNVALSSRISCIQHSTAIESNPSPSDIKLSQDALERLEQEAKALEQQQERQRLQRKRKCLDSFSNKFDNGVEHAPIGYTPNKNGTLNITQIAFTNPTNNTIFLPLVFVNQYGNHQPYYLYEGISVESGGRSIINKIIGKGQKAEIWYGPMLTHQTNVLPALQHIAYPWQTGFDDTEIFRVLSCAFDPDGSYNRANCQIFLEHALGSQANDNNIIIKRLSKHEKKCIHAALGLVKAFAGSVEFHDALRSEALKRPFMKLENIFEKMMKLTTIKLVPLIQYKTGPDGKKREASLTNTRTGPSKTLIASAEVKDENVTEAYMILNYREVDFSLPDIVFKLAHILAHEISHMGGFRDDKAYIISDIFIRCIGELQPKCKDISSIVSS